MKTREDWKPEERWQVLVWGMSGVGKTFGAGTFPRPCFIDFDKGIATLFNPEFISKHGAPPFIYEQFSEKAFGKGGIVTQHAAFDEAYEFVEKMSKPENSDKFDTWVLDSGTSMSEYAANKAVQVLGLMKLSQSFVQGRDVGLIVPKKQDYGAERSLAEQFVAAVKAKPKHFVMLCHEREIMNEKTQSVEMIVPLLTGKSTESIPLTFDEVYNLRTVKEGMAIKRILLTHPDGIRKVKTRYGVPDGVEWSWDALNKARASISGASRPTASAATR